MPRIDNVSPRGADDSDPLVPPRVGPLLDAKGASQLLNVPASWVLAEARGNRIPHVRLGRYVRFDADELRAWWMTRRRGPWRGGSAVTLAEPTTRDRAA